MNRSPLLTASLRRRLSRQGFAHLPLLAPHQVADLADLTLRTVPADLPPFYASPAHAWGPTAATFHAEVLDRLDDDLRAGFPGHRTFMVAATVKGPDGGQVMYHQDWTYTDERRHRPIFLWVPLVDVGPDNGVLRVVPRSHRHAARTIRPSLGLTVRQVTEGHQPEFEAASFVRPLRAGEALAFDPGMLHGSHDNTSGQIRPAITIALVPHDAQLVHFHQTPDGTLHGFEVDDAFFTEHDYATLPSGYPSVEPWYRAIEERDFDGVGRSGWARRRVVGA